MIIWKEISYNIKTDGKSRTSNHHMHTGKGDITVSTGGARLFSMNMNMSGE